MIEVLKTNDYTIFKVHENNRKINENNLNKIIFSLKKQNMLQFRPILVDKNMNVIDGQHRLEAAKQLNLTVYYQKNEEASHKDIVLLNTNQKPWSYEDYFNYYINLGNDDYKNIRNFCLENTITISEFIQQFCYDKSTISFKVKSGELKFPAEDQILKIKQLLDNVCDVLNEIDRYVISNKNICKSRKLRSALFSFLRNPDVDVKVLLNKISFKASSIHPCPGILSYYTMIRDIYNWRNSNPVV